LEEKKKVGYGIYNPIKAEIHISKRLSGLQTSFRAELMAIHKTLRIITTKYTNEPAHIFTDCLNCLYVLNTEIKHPTHHNNHADKTILTSMVKMLKSRTQPTTIYNVKAYTNIDGNEQAD
jgi:ribonuclease HI